MLNLDELTARSPEFVYMVTTMHGDRGREWMAGLPETVAAFAEQWSVVVGEPFANLSFNYVAPAAGSDGKKAVLKIGLPDFKNEGPNREFGNELNALRHYDGHGCCRVLAADEAAGVMLIERLEPGTMLSTLEDERATEIAAEVMQQLWRPAPREHTFPTIEDWGRGFERLRARFGGPGPFPPDLLEEAETLFAELSASASAPVVLHGDLHHFNILAAERESWLAIDPKGVVGEPAYEVGALLRNPIPDVQTWPDLARITARRIAQVAEITGLDRERIWGWAVAQAILSVWWSIEDGLEEKDWAPDLTVAEATRDAGKL